MPTFLTDDEINALEAKSASPNPEIPGLLTDADISRLESEEQEFDRPLAAGLAGAARGLSFGTSDLILSKSGLVDAKTLSGLREYNPTASIVGEVGGIAAPLLATGGTSLLARGAQVAGKGVLGVETAGNLVTQAVAKQFASDATKTTARKIIESGLARGAGSAIEGAAYGGGQLVTELSLNPDHELTAEQVLGTVGLSTLFGAGLGGGLGSITAAAPSILKRAQNFTNQAGSIINKAGSAVVDKVGSDVAGAAAKFSGQDAAIIEDLIKNPESRRLATVGKKESQEQVLEASDVIQQQYDHMGEVDAVINKVVRPTEQKSLLEPIPPEELKKYFNPGPKVKKDIEDARKSFARQQSREIGEFVYGKEIPASDLAHPLVDDLVLPKAKAVKAARDAKFETDTLYNVAPPFSSGLVDPKTKAVLDTDVGFYQSAEKSLKDAGFPIPTSPWERDYLFEPMKRLYDSADITPQMFFKASKIDAPYLIERDVQGNVRNIFPNLLWNPKKVTKMGMGEPKDHYDDPFAWFDRKHGVSKRVLKNTKNPIEINTSSDLIGTDEYLNVIPKGSTINLWIKRDVDGIVGNFGSFPSEKRLLEAAKKLEENGFKVNIKQPRDILPLSPTQTKQLSDLDKEFVSQMGQTVAETRPIAASTAAKALEFLKQKRNEISLSRSIKAGKKDLLDDYDSAIAKLSEAIEKNVPGFKQASSKLQEIQDLERKLSFWGISPKGVAEKKIQNLLLKMDDPAVANAAKSFERYNELLGIDTGKYGKKVRELVDSGVQDPVDQMVGIQNGANSLRIRTKAAINEMRAEPDIYASNMVRKLEMALQGMDRRLEDAATPYQMYRAINETKQVIQDLSKYGKTVSTTEQDAIARIREVANSFKRNLEDVNIYGPAAVAQESVNSKLSAFYTAKQIFEKEFTTKTLGRGGQVIRKVDPKKINAYLRDVQSASNAEKDIAFKNYLEASKNLLSEVDDISVHTPDVATLIKNNPILSRGNAPNEEFTKHIQKLVDQATKKANLRSLKAAEKTGLGPADVLYGAVSYAVGGPLGIAGLYALKLLNNPAQLVEGLSTLERMASGVNGQINRAINGLIHGTEKASKEFKSQLKGLPTPLSIAIFNKVSFGDKKPDEQDSRAAGFQKRLDELSELASNPALLSERLAKNLFNVGTVAPQVTEAMTEQAIRGVQYLYAQAPKNPSVGMMGKKPWTPSDFQLAKFERTVTAATYPLSILTSLQNGSLTTEEVNAVKFIYPKLYSQIQMGVMEETARLNEELPYQKRIQLSILFQVPLDNAMKPEFIQMLQTNLAAISEEEKVRQSGLENLKLSESRETNVQRVQGR